MGVMVFVCLSASNKRQNGKSDRVLNFWGNSHDPKEGMDDYSLKICHKKSMK